MKFRATLLLTVCILGFHVSSFGAAPTAAELGDICDVVETALRLKRQGKYREARQHCQRAIEMLGRGPEEGRNGLPCLLMTLSRLHSRLGNHDAAISTAKRAAELSRSGVSAIEGEVLAILAGLSMAYRSAGLVQEGITPLEEALKVAKQLYGEQDLRVARSALHLGHGYAWGGRYAEAEGPLSEALDIRLRHAKGSADLGVARALEELALVYRKQARYAESLSLLEQALDIRRKAQAQGHRKVAAVLRSQARVHRELADYAKAESLCRTALDLQQAALGKRHRDVVSALRALGFVYVTMKRYDEAEALLKEALEIATALEGDNQIEVSRSQWYLSILYTRVGQLDKAQAAAVAARRIVEGCRGAEVYTLAVCLQKEAEVHRHRREHRKALIRAMGALFFEKRRAGDSHPRVAEILTELGMIHGAMGRDAAAAKAYGEALRIRRHVFGETHPRVAQSLGDLATCQATRGEWAEAATLQRRSVNILTAVFASRPNHPSIIEARRRLDITQKRIGPMQK